jgi:hypothetical protein
MFFLITTLKSSSIDAQNQETITQHDRAFALVDCLSRSFAAYHVVLLPITFLGMSPTDDRGLGYDDTLRWMYSGSTESGWRK